jgi:hypothetical protein
VRGGDDSGESGCGAHGEARSGSEVGSCKETTTTCVRASVEEDDGGGSKCGTDGEARSGGGPSPSNLNYKLSVDHCRLDGLNDAHFASVNVNVDHINQKDLKIWTT